MVRAHRQPLSAEATETSTVSRALALAGSVHTALVSSEANEPNVPRISLIVSPFRTQKIFASLSINDYDQQAGHRGTATTANCQTGSSVASSNKSE